ncbi:proprotein convertase subtilisin/kexin type 5 [Boleophthalmus pectinirostris]|uniref:proprotein convertase subtilisin/kexin type 5 n=1 Tax=Boleophthalmus pectinirostris TaxID=150288 RepID=UPI002431D9D9|nr:proprotein convertase subtilisin/kexin type 5 [Boleophthalmus pectinirostris]
MLPVRSVLPVPVLSALLLALWVVFSGASSSSCPSGRFSLRGQCVLCHPSCSECSGHELFQCTACGVDEDGVERFLYHGRCVTHCPRSLYPDRGLSSCLPCVHNCELCTDASICAKCQDKYKLQSGRCQPATCDIGQVQDPDTGECVGCEPGCRTCSTENRAVCNSCNDGYFLFRSKCRRHCPQRTYTDSEGRSCVQCPAPCSDCSSSSCLSCLPSHFLSGGTCVKLCPPQTFGDTSGWRCEPCHSSCLSCRGPGPSDCELCQEDAAPVRGQCPGLRCSPGKYFNVRDGMCSDCDISCQSCFGSTSLDCSSCFKGFFLDQDGSCVEQCPSGSFSNSVLGVCENCAPYCELCADSSDNCVSCSKHGQTPFLHQGKCWSECPDGLFESEEGLCDPCDAPCQTCDGGSSLCLSCSEGHVLEGRSCRLNCSERMFRSEDGTCKHCLAHCDVCSDLHTCTKCSFLYLMLDGVCRASCPEWYYEDMEGGRCEPCHPTCASCSGPLGDDCDSCSSTSPMLYKGACFRECPSGTYYQTTAKECQECHQTCASCRGPEPNQCTECERGLVLDPSSLLCGVTGEAQCPLGTYLENDGFTCSSCRRGCLSCEGPQICSTCAAPHHLHNGTCVRSCPAGTYSSTQDADGHQLGFCLPCDPVCATCSGASAKDCVTCSPGHLRLLHLCVTHCPTGFYRGGSECKKCHHSCVMCSGPGPDSCRACAPPLLEIQGTNLCVEHCPQRFYQSGHLCRQCHISCQTCSDSSPQSCLSCDDGNTLKDDVCFPRCQEGTYSEQERCEPCDPSCRHCFGPGAQRCVSCHDDAGLHAVESRCAPCCSSHRNTTGCCVCDIRTALCVEAPAPRRGSDQDTDLSSASRVLKHTSAAMPLVLLLALGVVCGGVVLYRARSKRTMCWKRNYERLSGSATEAMPHGVPEPDSCDDVDVVYTSKGGCVYRRYSFSYEPEP